MDMKEVAQKQRLGTTYGRDAKIIVPDQALNEGPLRIEDLIRCPTEGAVELNP